MKNLLLHHPQR